jgi:hypothetical protein
MGAITPNTTAKIRNGTMVLRRTDIEILLSDVHMLPKAAMVTVSSARIGVNI